MTAVEVAQDSTVLEVTGLHHEYGAGNTAIEDISFRVRGHELVTIVGPSGCGKTTLLRSVSGLLTATAGSVRLLEREIDSVPRELAMVFQDYSRSLFPWLTVAANVELPLLYASLSRDERGERVAESLAAVGLARAADRHPWQLSGGMQQRVAIARALAYRPQILLMDEPFASVDAQTRAGLEDLVLDVRGRFGMTILVVTHDIDEAVYLADRVLVLSGSPSRVIDEVVVDLPPERDQIATKALPRFVELRSHVAAQVRHGVS
jgi:NitT/TauT family transport system ATP-binding protein